MDGEGREGGGGGARKEASEVESETEVETTEWVYPQMTHDIQAIHSRDHRHANATAASSLPSPTQQQVKHCEHSNRQ